MARPNLVSPDQPLLVRVLLNIYQFAASLGLAVVLLSLMAIALIFATFVEATFNTDVVQFYVYRSWWFGLIYALLGVNIFCAAAIRYPWKRHQTGFVITHIGLLMLLLSGAISRSKGIDAQVHVWENHASELAFDNAYYFDLRIDNEAGKPPMSLGTPKETVERHAVDFAPGMFNWSAYGEGFANWKVAEPELARWFSPIFYASLRNRAGNVLYDQDNIRLEVLDYYADCRWWENTPTVQLMMSMPSMQQRMTDGRMQDGEESWVPIRLSVFNAPQQPKYRFGVGDSQRSGGGTMTFYMAGSRAATEAFLKCVPEEGSIGPKGQAILFADGKTTVIQIDEQLEKEPQNLPGTNLKYQVKAYYPTAQLDQVGGQEFSWVEVPEDEGAEPRNPTVVIELLDGDKKVDELTLLANMPQMNMQAYDSNVFGHYWYDFGEKDAAELMRGEGGSRIDLIQGVAQGAADENDPAAKRVFYRYWNRKKVVASGELKGNATKLDAVEAFKMPIATLMMYVQSFVPSERPKPQPEKKPFGSSGPMGNTPAVKVRLTVDDSTEEFWLRAHLNEPDVGLDERSTLHTVKVGDRQVKLSMPIQSYPIGFRIYLQQFERRLDPGTSQPSHYSSDVNYLDRLKDRYVMRLSGGSISPLNIPGEINATSVAVHGQNLIWIDANTRSKAILSADLADPTVPAEQLIASAGTEPRNLTISEDGSQLFWIAKQMNRLNGREADVLMQANADGSEKKVIGLFDRSPSGLAVDTEGGWAYFGNIAEKSIGRLKLDGSDVENKWLESAGSVTAVALDRKNRTLYFADDLNNMIGKSTLDSPSISPVYTYKSDGQPNGIAVDSDRGLLYWTDVKPNGIDPTARKHLNDPKYYGGDAPKEQEINTAIRMLSLDGKSKDPQMIHNDLMDGLDGIAVDLASGDVYFTQRALLKRDVWITMNAPDDFTEPAGGRDLRIFQESFDGPYLAGTPEYREFVPERSNDSEVYKSVFSVNYDPGTALRYWGCLFVIGGIACMFYMRAYFFKTKRTSDPKARAKAHPAKIQSEVVTR